MDRQKILEQIICSLEKKYLGLKKSQESERNIVSGLEGRNMSRYDTMRIEGSWVVDGMKKEQDQLLKELTYAKGFKLPEYSSNITLGSLVLISTPQFQEQYFILPFYGGYETVFRNNSLIVITPLSPIAKILIGKTIFEEFEFNNLRYKIENSIN
jgi:hypothetical protein